MKAIEILIGQSTRLDLHPSTKGVTVKLDPEPWKGGRIDIAEFIGEKIGRVASCGLGTVYLTQEGGLLCVSEGSYGSQGKRMWETHIRPLSKGVWIVVDDPTLDLAPYGCEPAPGMYLLSAERGKRGWKVVAGEVTLADGTDTALAFIGGR